MHEKLKKIKRWEGKKLKENCFFRTRTGTMYDVWFFSMILCFFSPKISVYRIVPPPTGQGHAFFFAQKSLTHVLSEASKFLTFKKYFPIGIFKIFEACPESSQQTHVLRGGTTLFFFTPETRNRLIFFFLL